MHRIDSSNANNGQWVAGDPSTNTLPTYGTAAWFNSMQEEIAGFIEGQGIALQKSNNSQFAEALALKMTEVTDAAITEALNELPDVTPLPAFVQGTFGGNFEDIMRALYKVSEVAGTKLIILDNPVYSGLDYEGVEYTIDGKLYQYIKLLDTAAGQAMQTGKTAAQTASKGLHAQIMLTLSGMAVPNPARRGTMYAANHTAAGMVVAVSGSQSTIETAITMASGLILGGSGYSYYKSDLLLAPGIELRMEFDTKGVHLFVHRDDGDYVSGLSVFNASLTVAP